MIDVTRVLLAQLGHNGGDTMQAVARSLRDSGFDVVYAGRLDSPDDVIQAALQEDVDVIGVQGSGDVQCADMTVVDLTKTMTVEVAVAAIKSAGAGESDD